jgi:hypothetical protein
MILQSVSGKVSSKVLLSVHPPVNAFLNHGDAFAMMVR